MLSAIGPVSYPYVTLKIAEASKYLADAYMSGIEFANEVREFIVD